MHHIYILTAPAHLLFIFAFVVRDDLALFLCDVFVDMGFVLTKHLRAKYGDT